MRISGFLIGGILGAWAAMYFTRNNKPMVLGNVDWDKAVDKAGQVVRSAKTMWDSASIITASGSTPAGTSNKASASEAGLEQIEQIVSKDAELSNQVNEIMKESGSKLQ